ncbi:lactonase family protein [Salinarchaeum chitinilyticum]
MHYNAVIGTYSEHGSEGIYSCDVEFEADAEPGAGVSLEQRSVTEHSEHPTFLAAHPDEPLVYAVHEIESGQVSAYRFEDDGALAKLDQQRTGAAGPCHCSVHPSGRYLFVAQYAGGAVSMLPVESDGTIGAPVEVIEHDGSGPNADRQEAPHPHSVVCGPNGTFLYVPDLGTDEVVVYEIDAGSGSLVRTDAVRTDPGAGPRHFAFHPTRSLAYLVTELGSTIVAYEYDASTGALDEIGTTSTLPASYDDANQTSEIAVHPSGEWVYVANRGHDSIAASAVRDDGSLELVETVPTGGAWPRYFAIDPTGHLLFVQNRESDDVVPFRIDPDDGTLREADGRLSVPAPSCMIFQE